MKISLMHGLGNEYIVFDGTKARLNLSPAIIKKLCDRKSGIGADGIIIILPLHKFANSPAHSLAPADFRMRIFNADGSEAEMCGNGIRCLGKYAYEHGLTWKKTIKVETLAGIKTLDLDIKDNKVKNIRVEMGKPESIADCRLEILDKKFKAVKVSMGNPHCVIFVPDTVKFPVERYGPLIEKHRIFPKRTNVEFVRIVNKTNIKQRTWERGVGETTACGTGAAASVAAGIFKKRLTRKVSVHLKGGKLLVESKPDGTLYITGPAEELFYKNVSF
ncbi:MAG: diaminopimelate epimerase [Planctomycetes bacterium]|nr:diaminopimelate epimerase [Planctomycetota bacterium]